VTRERPTTARGPRLSDLMDALPRDLLVVRLFALALAAVLAGYMFMGRGFAHIGVGPVYVGEFVLALGIVTACIVVVRRGLRVTTNLTIALLLVFMFLGAARTIPYLGTYGLDALRDGVLWGYAAFALVIYLVADRVWIEAAVRLYGWIVPAFALWLPISWNVFQASQVGADPLNPGSNHPLVFFKAGDMAIHSAGAIAFIALGPPALATFRRFASRLIVSLPLTWGVFLTGAASRGALLGAATGLGATALATRRPKNWIPVASAALVVLIWLNAAVTIEWPFPAAPSTSSIPAESAPPPPSFAPIPTSDPGREVSASQWFTNFLSIFTSTSRSDLDGTRAYRLAWWSTILDYTVYGPYFWTGKGFGVNLADDDGFQGTLDHSLRAPHNSHMSVLARMGVLGLALWLLLQGAFITGLFRAIRAHRRADDQTMAGVGAWVLIVWAAMMVVTSFDPYLEGPQGGIWYWSIFGIGLVVMRVARRPTTR
jgi:hypothetical protein